MGKKETANTQRRAMDPLFRSAFICADRVIGNTIIIFATP